MKFLKIILKNNLHCPRIALPLQKYKQLNKKNMTKEVKEFCETYGLTVEQFYGCEVYKGTLDLSSLTELPEGFNPTVGGSIDLSSLKELPKGFNPTVDWCLFLNSVTELPDGFNPIVGGSLDLSNLTELPKDFNPTVAETLFLSSLKQLPEGFNPTVGGSLHLSSLIELPEGFSPTVGWCLYLSSLTELPEWYTTPKVKYNIWLKGYKDIVVSNVKDTNFLSWQDGKYIKTDGIFTEVVSHKGNVWKVKYLNTDKIFYLITDGNNNYAHGDTLQEAKDDLLFKVTDRKKDDYDGLTLDSELSYEESIICYRVITGACSYGTKDYVQNRLPKKKDSYTIAEIIELTKGEYGNEIFKEFFIK